MLTLVLAAGHPTAPPSEELAGITLVLRTVLTVQKAGASRIVLVTDADSAAIAAKDRRVRVPVEIVALRAGEPALEAAVRLVPRGSMAILARHDVLAAPDVYKELVGEPAGDGCGVVARGRNGALGRAFVAAALRVSPDDLGALARGGADLDTAIDALVRAGTLRVIDTSGWAERLVDQESRRRAFERLFEACRKPVDGLVARHLNRHISLFLSKRLVGTKVTPNMVSVVTLLLGVLAGVSVAQGGYLPILLGAFLWQWNSILDGVDGELARVRFEHSRLGQWLDTISDDFSNVVFWGALGFGSAALPWGRWLSLSGFVAAGANFAMAAVYYVQMIKMGSGDVYDIIGGAQRSDAVGWRGKVETAVRYVTKKDFFVLLCLVLALLGVLPYVLPLLAVFAVGALSSALVGLLRRAPRSGPAR
jgi:1L-myo-inositol 1-phosphate cytidylyltransferase / CDP-L-myo-inositol myo-inositolphosphotransferase